MKARCSHCPRHVQVRKDGTLHAHLFANRDGRVLTTKCPGGGEPPSTRLTAEEALAVLRREHEPYLPVVVEVSDDGATWREPTVQDQADSLEWWCDGCNRAASRCTVATVLALVDG